MVLPRASKPGVAASEHGMVEGGLSADVIAYTTTQGYGVVVVQPVRLCASKKRELATGLLSVFCLGRGCCV